MTDPLHLLLLFGVGLVAGTLNVVAAGGSLITLPVLIFLGLPVAVANGTNRIAILAQNVVATADFQRRGVLPVRLAVLCATPALAGSIIGARLAVDMDEEMFRRVLAGVMLLVLVVMVVDPAKRLRFDPARLGPVRRIALAGTFFLVGIHGGFIQAGVGFVIISGLLLHGLEMVQVNAVKVAVILVFTVAALVVFVVNGQVDWPMGLALAAGNAIGGRIGTKLTVETGHVWLRRVVFVVVIIFAVRLLWP
ncbi:sulfite exporter TauE/SafE family protein [bacterium]|nr:MAG: sulfite exporter TauE/SafE family protein [bacterium]